MHMEGGKRKRRAVSLAWAVFAGMIAATPLLAGCRSDGRLGTMPVRSGEASGVTNAPVQDGADLVLVGYCDYSSIELLGTWSKRYGWRDAAGEVFRQLLPGGGQWTLYGVNRTPMTVVSRAPEKGISEKGQAYWYAPLAEPIDPVSGKRDWLAVSGASSVDLTDIKALPIDEGPLPAACVSPPTEYYRRDQRTEFFRSRLRACGYWQADRPVVQNLLVDLDGDGTQDQLLTVDQGMSYYVDLTAAGLKESSGDLDVSVLTFDACKRYRANGLLTARVLAVADINGDGTREVALLLGSLDARGCEVHSIVERSYRLVLHLDVGDA